MQVVDATTRNTTQRRKAAGVCVKQHLVTLAWVGHQPEGTAGAQLHVRHLKSIVDTADHQPLFAPIELERLTQLKAQGHESVHHRMPLSVAPRTDEISDARVAAAVPSGPHLAEQRQRRTPLALGSMCIDLQRLLDRLVKRSELARSQSSPVLRFALHGFTQTLANRVSRQTRDARNLSHRLALAVVEPPNLANHLHGDHSSFPCA